MHRLAEATRLPAGVHWDPRGWVSLSDPALQLYTAFDRMIERLAIAHGAARLRPPALCGVEELEHSGATRAFPQLVSPIDHAHGLRMAACAGLFGLRRDARLERPERWTLRAACTRREERLEPMRRQRHFAMREFVLLGDAADVARGVAEFEAGLSRVLARLELGGTWCVANDPFFAGDECGAAILQRAEERKREYVVDGLALASINRHERALTDAFSIRTAHGPAHSACIAFGLERWLFALERRWGLDPRRWPPLLRRERRHV